MQIHIAKNGQQLGPYTEEQLGELLQTGQVSYDDLAWTEGMADWQLLRTICAPPQGTPPPPPPPTAFPSVTGTPTALPSFAPSSQPSGKKTGRIVPILSILFGIFFGLFFLGVYSDQQFSDEKVFLVFLSGFLVASVAASVYLLPTWIAGKRRLPNFWWIFLLNLVAGATGIGWLVCLFWVCLAKSPAKSESAPSMAAFKISASKKSWLDLFATHPPIEERISALRKL